MPLGELALAIKDRSLKGEIVLVVDRAAPFRADEETLDAALDAALRDMSVKGSGRSGGA